MVANFAPCVFNSSILTGLLANQLLVADLDCPFRMVVSIIPRYASKVSNRLKKTFLYLFVVQVRIEHAILSSCSLLASFVLVTTQYGIIHRLFQSASWICPELSRSASNETTSRYSTQLLGVPTEVKNRVIWRTVAVNSPCVYPNPKCFQFQTMLNKEFIHLLVIFLFWNIDMNIGLPKLMPYHNGSLITHEHSDCCCQCKREVQVCACHNSIHILMWNLQHLET